MAESTVERDERDTSNSSGPLRLGLRLAVRGLVVAGFAGTAWLLSSLAAHAAEAHTVPAASAASAVDPVPSAGLMSSIADLSSVVDLSSIVDLPAIEPVNQVVAPVTRALTTTTRPVGATLDRLTGS